MKGKKPHEQLTTNDNGLTKMQEVTYRRELKDMENGNSTNHQNKNQNQANKYNL